MKQQLTFLTVVCTFLWDWRLVIAMISNFWCNFTMEGLLRTWKFELSCRKLVRRDSGASAVHIAVPWRMYLLQTVTWGRIWSASSSYQVCDYPWSHRSVLWRGFVDQVKPDRLQESCMHLGHTSDIRFVFPLELSLTTPKPMIIRCVAESSADEPHEWHPSLTTQPKSTSHTWPHHEAYMYVLWHS